MQSQAMVVCPQPEAAESGIEMLEKGGNAVDAAIACALAQTVVDPLMCGIAGFGSLGLYMPGKGLHEYLDFHAPAPKAARPDMWEDRVEGETRDGFGFVLKDRVNDLGYGAICVPAALRAYEEVHRAHGRLSWETILQPAVEWAENGFFVRPAMYTFFMEGSKMGRAATAERLAFSATGRELYCRPDGTPLTVGEPIRNPDYAATLRRIAEHGAEDFYTGEIGARIAADMAANGALLSGDDLSDYSPQRKAPLTASYRGRRITTNQPPGGGVMLVEMLNILENFDLAGLGHNSPDYIRTVCEAMKRATIDKDRHVGDPRFLDVPLAYLTDKAYARELAGEIRAGVRAEVPRLQAPNAVPVNTTHLSVVDGDGNCVSMTHSLGMPSGVITDGLGFLYNGCMGVFDPRPGRAGSIAPGKSRFSAMCPTIVFDGDRPELVLGAPGGTQIVMGVLQTILNVVDFGMSVGEAVAAPRFSSTGNPIDVSNRIRRSIARELESEGYEVIRNPYGHTIGWVHAVGIRPDGTMEGAADPGRDGVAYGLR
ncbi:putative gamma-glutamyltranspeptidase [Aurantimonas manganoxydans SI85-9A1]|uniref:Glutathione hydrolase proenzyme n=1 Tax=Aurantimonas manganoxydans (strain ATCC BAA-1229 / DSM 21871 / SI85-9A1) TaxID=287752 RepID=Q1YLD2_AURMS|nr:gamma-glutamyltransferase [Aurantimonas manganoxydans]EAS51799.1 putative gamma-glutamyltranspeptidase [Aurantimonas manganoxydans SI85-9A1]